VFDEWAGLEDERARLVAASGSRVARAAGGRLMPAARPLAAFVDAPEIVGQLHALAVKHGAGLERVTCLLKLRDGARRLEVTLPLKTRYPALRGFLTDALALAPAAALDGLALQRTHAADVEIDAQIRISYHFASS
jgi:hypothetical protein